MLLPLLSIVANGTELPEPTHKVGPRKRVRVEMRDGHTLRTVVRRPKGDGPFPTIFTRTPYPMGFILGRQCKVFVEQGYACGWQVVRGTGRDAGRGGEDGWHPFVHDEADGQDAVAWIREQPWSDGQVA